MDLLSLFQTTPRTLPRLYVISGAGLSAESGIPTFRGDNGVWEGNDLDVVCNYHTWKKHREAVFQFYRHARLRLDEVAPCAAHMTLARWQEQWGVDRVKLLTQNVDDLLEQAGAQEVLHLHGNLHSLVCKNCENQWQVTETQYDHHTECPTCKTNHEVKPAVIFFHEQAPEYIKLLALGQMITPSDIVLVIGSSMQVVGPDLFLPLSRKGHARNIQINLELSNEEWFDMNIEGPASESLDQIESVLENWMKK